MGITFNVGGKAYLGATLSGTFQDLTISLWVRVPSVAFTGGNNRILDRDFVNGYAVFQEASTGQPTLSKQVTFASPGTILTANVWSNLIYTYNDATGGLVVYHNGTSVATATAGTTDGAWGGFGIGANHSTSVGNEQYAGDIAEVAHWNSLLGSSDRTALQTASPGTVATGSLRNYWKLLTAPGSTESDLAGSDHLSVITGSGGSLSTTDTHPISYGSPWYYFAQQ